MGESMDDDWFHTVSACRARLVNRLPYSPRMKAALAALEAADSLWTHSNELDAAHVIAGLIGPTEETREELEILDAARTFVQSVAGTTAPREPRG